MFRANRFRPSRDLAATEKLAVSPQPPIAIMTAVPGANCDLTASTVVKSGQVEGSGSLKMEEGINASCTCVMPDTRESLGTTLCWLWMDK